MRWCGSATPPPDHGAGATKAYVPLTLFAHSDAMREQAFTERYLWIVGNLLVIGLFAVDVSQLQGFNVGGHVMWGRDFLIVWSAGRLAIEGQLAAIYDLGRFAAFQRATFGPLSMHIYSYPPSSLLLGLPFGALPYPLAYALWTIAGSSLFWWAARPHLAAAGLPSWLALATPAATINLWAGHFGFLLGALWLFAFRDFDRRPKRGGVITALMLVKPHMAVLIPVVLLRRARWGAIAAAAGGVALLVLLSLLAFGSAPWHRFFEVIGPIEALTFASTGQFFGTMMPGIAVALLRHPLTAPLAMPAQAAGAFVAIVLLWRATGRDVPIARLTFPAATATFLVLPYAFDYDMTVACLGLMLTLHRRWALIAIWERTALGVGFLVPQLCILLGLTGITVAPLILLAALIAQLRAEGLLGASRDAPFVPNGTAEKASHAGSVQRHPETSS